MTAENIGSAEVTIEAQFGDFDEDVQRRLVAAAKRAGTAAEKQLGESGSRAGKQFAAGVSKASGSTKTLDAIRASVEKLEKAAVRAGNAQVDAADRVWAAEQALSKAKAQSVKDTVRIEAAERRLAKARRDAARADDLATTAAQTLGDVRARLEREGTAAGRGFLARLRAVLSRSEGEKTGSRFGDGLRKWLTGKGADLGKAGGSVFGSGFLGALKTPVIGPAIVAVLTAAVLTFVPAVGAIAAGAFVAAFGAGLTVLGAVFAAKTPAVQAAWKKTLADMAADLQVLSKPFETTLTHLADVTRVAFQQLKPALAAAFSDLAPALSTFGSELGKALSSPTVSASIREIASSFSTLLGNLGPALSGTIETIASALTKLAQSVQENPEALGELVTGLGELSSFVLGFLGTLNSLNSGFSDLTGGISLVDAALASIAGLLAPLVGLFEALNRGVGLLNALTKSSDASGQSMSDAAAKTVALANGLQKTGTAASATTSQAERLAVQFNRQKAATDALIVSLNRLSGLNLSLSDAQIQYQAALDAGNASLKENGRTLDLNTAKGRANQQSLNDIARAANEQRDAMIRAGSSQAQAASTAQGARANFARLAQQMGLSAKEARDLAAKMIAIPNVSRRAILTANVKDLESKLATARERLNDPNLTKTRRAKIEATIAQLERQVREAKAALASVKDKQVDLTIRVNTYKNLIETKIPGGDGVRAREKGGPVTAGQPYLVGEKRPEIFVPKVSGTILPRVPASFGPGLASALHGTGLNAGSGLAGGMAAAGPAVASAAASLAATVRNTVASRLQIHSPSRVTRKLGNDAAQGLIIGLREKIPQLRAALIGLTVAIPSQIQSSINKVGSALKSIGGALTSSTRTRLNSLIASTSTGLATIQRAATAVDTRLTRATQNLKNLQEQAQQLSQTVSQAVLQSGNIAQSQNTSFAGIVSQLRNAVNNAKQFSTVLAGLRKAGLNAASLQQLAEAGPETGTAIGTSILRAGRAGVQQVNKLQAELQKAAAAAAKTASDAVFGQGLRLAQGVVAGLQKQKAALDRQMTRLADVLVLRVLSLLRALKLPGVNTLNIPGFAEGGVVSREQVVRVAERNRREAIVPLTKPRRAQEIMDRTGLSAMASPQSGGRMRTVEVPVHIAGNVVDYAALEAHIAQVLTKFGFRPVLGLNVAGGTL